MKQEKHKTQQEEKALFDEVHLAEGEIDLFLKNKTQEAERILLKARRRFETENKQAVEKAREETVRVRETLLLEAEEEASRILKEASAEVERERTALEKVRTPVIEKILNLLLGGGQ